MIISFMPLLLYFSESLLNDQDFKSSVIINPSISGLFSIKSNLLEFNPIDHYGKNTVYTVTVKKNLLAEGRKPLDKETYFTF